MTLTDTLFCFLLAAIAGTGIGGGGLYLLYMTTVMSIGHTAAQAVNLLFFVSAAIPATLTRLRTLPWSSALLCIAGGIPGVFLGTWLRNLLEGDMLSKIFGGMLIVSGASVFFLKEKKH